MKYSEIQHIYIQLFKHPIVSVFIKIACAMAILFIVVQLVRKFIKSAGDSSNKIKPYDFIRPAIIVAVLVSFSTVLTLIDQISTVTDAQLNTYFQDPKTYEQKKEIENVQKQYEDPNLGKTGMTGAWARTLAFIEKIESYPKLLLWDILQALGELINSITYTVAIVIRFAMLFFLRCFGPIALVFAIFDKYENSFWNWLRQYAFYYFWIYAIFVINVFFDLFYQYTDTVFLASHVGSEEGWAAGSLKLAAVVAKIVLYKRSYTLLGDIITGK
jgi:hypothetical protein